MYARKLLLKLVPVLLIFFVIASCSEQPEPDGLDAHPAIWKLGNGDAQVYLLGSIHLLPPDMKWYGGQIEKLVDDAQEVVFEVHMTAQTQAQAQAITMQNGMLSGGDVLSNYVSEEEYAFLQELAPKLGIPAEAIANFKPWFASIALSVSAIIQEGWDPDAGVDKHILEIATERQLKISGLETIEAQMETLYNHPLDAQANMLKDTISELKDIRNITLEMVDVWASGDEDRLVDTFLVPMQEQPELYAKIITGRNQNWILALENLASKKQTTLVVVGTAHLVGEGGVVDLLREKGYDVERIQ
jgi:uncharacterized protein|tara:strand:- start:46961 stop:47866 length:906 start_codon:yes stop_codon:yes gene_type:complete